jgi:hypothetical protein
MASISVVDAAREAAQHTRRNLFPVNPAKWIILGFLALLDQCGRSLTGGGPQGRRGVNVNPWYEPHPFDHGDLHRLADAARAASAWVSDHAALLALGVVVLVVGVAALLAVVLWINARGTFMYLDDVASGRSDVARPWREHASAAWSYFGWRFTLSFGSFIVFLLAIGVALICVQGFLTGRFAGSGGGLALLALVPMGVVLLLSIPLLALAHVALRDFVAPLQMMTGGTCGASARLLETLVTEHPGAFIVYLLLKFLFVVVTAVVVAVGGCLTCCVGWLPFVRQTVFQPIYYFERSWSVLLLKQMGHDLPGRFTA